MASILEDLRLNGVPLNGYEDGHTNLVTNPSIEVAASDWSGTARGPIGTSSAIARSGAQAYPLGWSLAVTTPSAGNWTGASIAVGALAAGETVTARVMVRVPTTQSMGIALEDNLLGNGMQTADVVVPANTWTALDVTWTPTALSVNAMLYVYQRTLSLPQTWHLDAAIVVRGAAMPGYFDGDTPGYYWTGADGLSTSLSSPLTLESLTMPPPPALAEWIRGADSDGAILARAPLHDNRVIEAQIRVAEQLTEDLALAAIGLLEDQLQECGRQAYGCPLVWAPTNSTVAPITFRCLHGEIVDMPIDWRDSGWFVQTPVMTVRMTCLPFGLGDEYQAGTVTSAAPIVTLELADVPGDVPALGRLIVSDAASKHRRYVAWGLESLWYDAATSPIIDSTSMGTTGFAGATATRAGAYSGATNNVISATLRTQLQAICGLGAPAGAGLPYVGAFRPQLRFYASATTIALRLTYQVGDGPLQSKPYRIPVVAGWNHVDLGLITIPQTTLGTQRLAGRIEAYSTATGGETLAIDAIWMMPAEQYGVARASYSYSPGVLTALDQFTGTTAGGGLSGSSAPVGGAWGSAGASTDFTFADGPGASDETITRTTTVEASPRVAFIASSVTDCEVGVDYELTSALSSANGIEMGVLARYTDVSNYARATFRHAGSLARYFQVAVRIAGVETIVASQFMDARGARVRFIVRATGDFVATLFDAQGAVLSELRGTHTALATGGALVTGKPGIYDINPTALGVRYYDNFYAATPAAEPIVCYSGQSIEFRHDSALREDATGTYAGVPPEPIGSRFTVPNAGGPDRKTRVAVIARRNDVAVAADNDVVSNATMDSTVVTAMLTPRYLAVPR